MEKKKFEKTLTVGNKNYKIFSLKKAQEEGFKNISKLPITLKILFENLLRNFNGISVAKSNLEAICNWIEKGKSEQEIAFSPTRILMQDFTGVPAVVDLAVMRDAMVKMNKDPDKINPMIPVDSVIDHSVQVEKFASPLAFKENVQIEMQRNDERYRFLKWAQSSFKNFRVVPPGTGICHQVNLEYLGKVVDTKEENKVLYAFPDTLVGTDSHTTMINGLGILGWGVGGIEAEAALLNQPISMLIPEVIGMRLIGKLKEGITATDLVLTVTQMLRKKGVVGKFVEFFGSGLDFLPLADRATIANMSPEYGATCGFFPVDKETLSYLHLTGRSETLVALVEAYAKEQGMWREDKDEVVFSDVLELDLNLVEPSLSGPKRPQDRVGLSDVANRFRELMRSDTKDIQLQEIPAKAEEELKNADLIVLEQEKHKNFSFTRDENGLKDGDVVIAAITSCTNTSNPSVMVAAGLIAKKAIEKGMRCRPWVKTSLAPGSKVVTSYLKETGLQKYLDQLGFYLVGYGCTTCIGNSGPLPENIAKQVQDKNLVVSAVLSGNRNFEGRIHPQVKANWLASPPLVVIYALTGTVLTDVQKEPIGEDKEGKWVYLKDLWPTNKEIANATEHVKESMFKTQYSEVFSGDKIWNNFSSKSTKTYPWDENSTYVRKPSFFEDIQKKENNAKNIYKGRILAILGDSITTDHISPAGAIKKDSPAGKYLLSKKIAQEDFNSYGSRRGNHEVLTRGTFANIRIRNEMTPFKEGGFTKVFPSKEEMPIYDAAIKYKQDNIPLIIIAGKEYGSGSSRDWAAKGPLLLGVKAVITESIERIHRSNLIGMGILPLEFPEKINRKSLQLTGEEVIDILGLDQKLKCNMKLKMRITYPDKTQQEIEVISRIDTPNEIEYYKSGGILQHVLHNFSKE